ncbi:lon-like protease [Enterococcus sp. AZ135]|uniref:S16 family serine protease n=1 Tax=unclassified Enterococcus TaxID=2608891 RepID=UPI003F207892
MKRFSKYFVIGLLSVAVIYFAFFYRIPDLYITKPGPVADAMEMVSVADSASKSDSEILVTTVKRKQGTVFTLIKALIHPYQNLSKESQNYEAVRQDSRDVQQAFMANSKQTAVTEAFRLAEKEKELEFTGIRVMTINRDVQALEELRINDVILSINGEKATPGALATLPQRLRAAQTELVVAREGKKQELSIPRITRSGYLLNGVLAVTANESVRINSKGFGGPSAGAMLTLSIYQQITGQDLLNGRTVAGTGTIEANGNVGLVGGIPQKVYAAHHSQAEIFFVPYLGNEEGTFSTNYFEARKVAADIHSEMTIVPVGDMADIIEYLEMNT